MIKSLRELAKAVGRSPAAVMVWRKRDDWPIGAGPWSSGDVKRLKAWMVANLREAHEGGDSQPENVGDVSQLSPLKRAELGLKLKRRELIGVQADILRGKYHDTDQCQQRILGLLQQLKLRIMAIPKGSPYTPEINQWFNDRIREALEDLSKSAQAPGK